MKNKPETISQEDWDSVESPPLSSGLLAKMKPVKEIHPNIPKHVRVPNTGTEKVPVSIQLSPEVVDYFKSQGKEWQSNINTILHEYIITHRVDISR